MAFTTMTSDTGHSASAAFSGTQPAELVGERPEREDSGRGTRNDGFADMGRHEDSKTINFTNVPSTTRALSTVRSGNPIFQLPENVDAPVQNITGTMPSGARNPIDVDAPHSTRNRPVPNRYTVDKPHTGSRHGINDSLYADVRLSRSVPAGPNLRRQVVSRPVYPGPEAVGQSLQRLCRTQPSANIDTEGSTGNRVASHQSLVTPYHQPQMSEPAELNPRYSDYARYSHGPRYPVGLPQDSSLPFQPPHPAAPSMNYALRSDPAPVNRVESRYHRSAVPTSASLPPIGVFQPSNEEHSRGKKVQYTKEYAYPYSRKRGMPGDSEAMRGMEYESGASFSNVSNGNVPPNTGTTANGPSLSHRTRPVSQTRHFPLTAYSQDVATGYQSVETAALISHTQLLTTLFNLYPHSHDQKRMRGSMTRLSEIQNQCFKDWLSAEENIHLSGGYQLPTAHAKPSGYKTQAMRQDEEANSVVNNVSERVEKEVMEIEPEQEIKKLLPSSSAVWDKKDGLRARDLYAVTEQMSPPVYSEEEEDTDMEG